MRTIERPSPATAGAVALMLLLLGFSGLLAVSEALAAPASSQLGDLGGGRFNLGGYVCWALYASLGACAFLGLPAAVVACAAGVLSLIAQYC